MATLHFIAGRAGSGKTTLARRLAVKVPALVISEDEWISRLAGPIQDLEQYLTAASRVRSVIAPLSMELLKLGTSVVFDFAGNTARDRQWVRAIFESAGADHVLHALDADEATCKTRVQLRNASQPAGIYFGVVTDRQLDEVNRFYEPPRPDERFTVVVHPAKNE